TYYEFIYDEDLERTQAAAPEIKEDLPKLKKDAFQLIIDTILALKRENRDTLYSSMIKDTLKRKKPQFDEGYHGYRSWQDLLEDMERNGVLELTRGPRSGTYVGTGFGEKEEKEAGQTGPLPCPLEGRVSGLRAWRVVGVPGPDSR